MLLLPSFADHLETAAEQKELPWPLLCTHIHKERRCYVVPFFLLLLSNLVLSDNSHYVLQKKTKRFHLSLFTAAAAAITAPVIIIVTSSIAAKIDIRQRRCGGHKRFDPFRGTDRQSSVQKSPNRAEAYWKKDLGDKSFYYHNVIAALTSIKSY